MRLRRGRLQGEQRAGRWYVFLPGEQGEQPPEQLPGQRPGEPEQPTGQAELVAELRARVADLSAALERSQQGEAELRRMLNLEQQTVAALRALPAPVDIVATQPEAATTAPLPVEAADTAPADLARELKRRGVKGKKARQAVAAWVSSMLRR